MTDIESLLRAAPHALSFPDRCIFCGAQGRSKEHVYAKWLAPYLPETTGRSEHVIVRTEGPDGSIRILEPGPNHGSSHGYSKTLKVVCKRCNNGWMSALQTRAKPWLKSLIALRWPMFTDEGQRAVAAWATMFTMVAEYMDHARVGVWPHEREAFMNSREPLPGWYIWLGGYGRGDRTALNHMGFTRYNPFSTLTNMQVSTFNVGRFFIHVQSSFTMFEEDAAAFATRFGLVTLWPQGGRLDQPPRTAHDYAGLMAVANDFAMRVGHNPLGHEPVTLPLRGPKA